MMILSNNKTAKTSLLLFLANVVSSAALQAGDTICTEGFVMDFFCINRGTLLDNPSVRTLEEPGRHSVHCLVDVNSCVSSPFEILLDPKGGPDELFKRGWQLDEPSKQQAIALAQSVGSCSTCDPANNRQNSHVEGFRMAALATILDLNEDDASLPPIISVQEIQDTTAFVSTNGESACSVLFGVDDILDVAASSSATGESDTGDGEDESQGGGSILENIVVGVDPAQAGNSLRRTHMIHASLMMISWGFLLPSGTILAKFFKHRPDGLWFKLHRAIQSFGLLLAIIGWIIALMNFNVFLDVGFRNYQHGICGMVVMILGILQPLNAIARPHLPKDGEEKAFKRKAWEIVHRGSGWAAVLLAVPTIWLGTLSLPNPSDTTLLQIGYGSGCIGGLLLLLIYIFWDKKNFETEQTKQQKAAMAAREEGAP